MGEFEPKSGVMAFIRGDITTELHEQHEEIRGDLLKVEQLSNDLMQANEDTILALLKTILERAEAGDDTVPEVDALIEVGSTDTSDHMHMPLLSLSAKARIPAWLHGEAGSGKSTAAEKIAENSKMDFRSISLCPTTSKSDILGYRDATGQYRSTGFRDIYENGGVFLFDEIDNSHPSSLAVINHALANTIAEFPDGSVERHPDTIVIAAANTLGRGANAQYVGRSVIDAATRDRFVYIPWNIDEALEERLVSGAKVKSQHISVGEGGIPSSKEWLSIVRANREALAELGIKQLCSPRAAIYGAKLAKLGIGKSWLEELCIYKGMVESERTKVQEQIRYQARSRMPNDLAKVSGLTF